jgi:hypothetical protein
MRLSAGKRPRPVAVVRQAPAEQNAPVAHDEHADAVSFFRGLDRVADVQRAARQDGRSEAAAMGKSPQETPPRELLQVTARLAELHPAA